MHILISYASILRTLASTYKAMYEASLGPMKIFSSSCLMNYKLAIYSDIFILLLFISSSLLLHYDYLRIYTYVTSFLFGATNRILYYIIFMLLLRLCYLWRYCYSSNDFLSWLYFLVKIIRASRFLCKFWEYSSVSFVMLFSAGPISSFFYIFSSYSKNYLHFYMLHSYYTA